PLHYRSRVKLVPSWPAGPAWAVGTSSQPAPRVILGAYAPRSHRVLDMTGCQVNAKALRAIARELAAGSGQARPSIPAVQSGRGSLRYVLLREVRSGAAQVSLVVAEPPPRTPLLGVVSALRASFPQLASVVLHHNARPGNALLVATDRATDRSDAAEQSEPS